MADPDVVITSPINTTFRVSYSGFLWVEDSSGKNMVLVTNMERASLREALDLADRKAAGWRASERA